MLEICNDKAYDLLKDVDHQALHVVIRASQSLLTRTNKREQAMVLWQYCNKACCHTSSQEVNELPSTLHAVYKISSINMDIFQNDAIQIEEISNVA